MSTGWERLVLPAKGVVVEPWYVSESSNVRSNSNPEISVEAIKGIIRSAAVKYDVFPPAEEIDQFTTLIIDRIEKEKPEDPFKYAEEEVDKWFRANKLRWVREIRPERIRTVIRKLTTAFRTRAFHAIRPEELRIVREYIEVLPELDELKNAILEALAETPRTRKGAEDLLKILEDVHFRVIAETLEIVDRVEEGIRKVREAMEKLAKPAARPEVSARLLLTKLKRRVSVHTNNTFRMMLCSILPKQTHC